MGAYQRRKGHNFEREMARWFREALPGCDAKRGFQTRGGGAEAPDVLVPGLHVECKRGRQPNIRRAYQQAVEDADARQKKATQRDLPLAITRDDHGHALVTLSLEDFRPLLQLWFSHGRPPSPLEQSPAASTTAPSSDR